MKQTILITGTSAGIGKATAKYFQEKGWNVAATMRTPENENELNNIDGIKVYKLDVTDETSIHNTIEAAISDFGKIDVVLNNAGYGLFGAFESAKTEQIIRQFNTNVFGVMSMTKAILPHFRANKSGIIINVTSIGGLVTFPLNSIYHAAKFAVEGFSESLNYELEPLNIQVKLVEPGGVSTDFSGRSLDIATDNALADYNSTFQSVLGAFESRRGTSYSKPEDIAEVIYQAATDNSKQLRYVAGDDAKQIYAMRRSVSQEEFYQNVKQNFGLK